MPRFNVNLEIDRTDPTPLYYQVKKQILALIEDNILKEDSPLPPEMEMANRHNLSRTVIRQALLELTKEGYLRRIRGKGTFVANHRQMKSGEDRRLNNIGICFLDIYDVTHPYFSRLVNSVTASCSKNGYNLQVFSTHASEVDNHDKSPFIRAIKSRHLSGLLLASRMGLKDILLLKEMNIPFVWINLDIYEEGINCVLVDYFAAAFESTKHLIALGHKRIGLIRGSKNNRNSILSLHGYKFAMEEQGIDFDANLVRGTAFTEKVGYIAMNEFLNLPEPPTAAYGIDDSLAAGAMKSIAERGLKIPDDVAIIGCGNSLSPYSTEPSLTTLDIHLEELGELALEMLLKIIEKKKVEESRVMLKPTLIIRQSCGVNRRTEGNLSPVYKEVNQNGIN